MISTVAVTLWYLPKYYDNPMLSCLFQNSDQHSLKSVPKTLIYSDCWWPYFEVNFVNKYKFIHWECFQTFVWRLIKQQIVGMQRNQRDHFFYNIIWKTFAFHRTECSHDSIFRNCSTFLEITFNTFCYQITASVSVCEDCFHF